MQIEGYYAFTYTIDGKRYRAGAVCGTDLRFKKIVITCDDDQLASREAEQERRFCGVCGTQYAADQVCSNCHCAGCSLCGNTTKNDLRSTCINCRSCGRLYPAMYAFCIFCGTQR